MRMGIEFSPIPRRKKCRGILYYGYLDNSQDTDDKFTDNLKGMKGDFL